MLGAKYFTDGTPGCGSASYVGTQYSGRVTMSQEELVAAFRDAIDHDEQVEIHATGQLAGKAVLDAIEAAGPAATRIRARIVHLDSLLPEDLPRLGKAGVFVNMQPAHFTIFAPASIPPATLLPPPMQLFHTY